MYANGIQISQITSWITLYRFAPLPLPFPFFCWFCPIFLGLNHSPFGWLPTCTCGTWWRSGWYFHVVCIIFAAVSFKLDIQLLRSKILRSSHPPCPSQKVWMASDRTATEQIKKRSRLVAHVIFFDSQSGLIFLRQKCGISMFCDNLRQNGVEIQPKRALERAPERAKRPARERATEILSGSLWISLCLFLTLSDSVWLSLALSCLQSPWLAHKALAQFEEEEEKDIFARKTRRLTSNATRVANNIFLHKSSFSLNKIKFDLERSLMIISGPRRPTKPHITSSFQSCLHILSSFPFHFHFCPGCRLYL